MVVEQTNVHESIYLLCDSTDHGTIRRNELSPPSGGWISVRFPSQRSQGHRIHAKSAGAIFLWSQYELLSACRSVPPAPPRNLRRESRRLSFLVPRAMLLNWAGLRLCLYFRTHRPLAADSWHWCGCGHCQRNPPYGQVAPRQPATPRPSMSGRYEWFRQRLSCIGLRLQAIAMGKGPAPASLRVCLSIGAAFRYLECRPSNRIGSRQVFSSNCIFFSLPSSSFDDI